jgi:hypothetical protein
MIGRGGKGGKDLLRVSCVLRTKDMKREHWVVTNFVYATFTR